MAGPHANADDFASFSTFDLATDQTAQGISDVGAGTLKFGSREFLLAQRVWFEPSLEREKSDRSHHRNRPRTRARLVTHARPSKHAGKRANRGIRVAAAQSLK